MPLSLLRPFLFAILVILLLRRLVEKVIFKKQAVKDFVSIDTIANLCLLLAAKLSNTLTGGALPVDGGWPAQ